MRRSLLIDEIVSSQQKLYEPLRKSLLRPSYLSQNKIQSQSSSIYTLNNYENNHNINKMSNRNTSAVLNHNNNNNNSIKNIYQYKNRQKLSQQQYQSINMNDLELSSSRLSKRMRSLSPEQVEQIKSSIYIPINKKLIPTNNYQKIKNKRFSAINIEQKIHQPISQNKFKQITSSMQRNKIEQIVYQIKQQVNFNETIDNNVYNMYKNGQYYQGSPHVSMYQSQQIIRNVQPKILINRQFYNSTILNNAGQVPARPGETRYISNINYNNGSIVNRSSLNYSNDVRSTLFSNNNIYTARRQSNNNIKRINNTSQSPRVSFNHKHVGQFIQNNARMGIINNVHSRNHIMYGNNNNINIAVKKSVSPQSHNINFVHAVPNTIPLSLQQNKASFRVSNQNIYTSPLQKPLATFKNINIINNNVTSFDHKQKINSNNNILSQTSLLSPLNSQTSFECEKQKQKQKTYKNIKMPNKVKQYDFSKQSTSVSQDVNNFDGNGKNMHEERQFKYNLFSILDQPSNTKCERTGCMNNQIVASRNVTKYEWRN